LVADCARHVVRIEGLREFVRERRMNEDEHSKPTSFAPERFEVGAIDMNTIDLRCDHDTGKSELNRASRQLASAPAPAARKEATRTRQGTGSREAVSLEPTHARIFNLWMR
jgi:hypothetical protein